MYPTSNVRVVERNADPSVCVMCEWPATFFYPAPMCTPCHREWSE
jgi:hypothetical protein